MKCTLLEILKVSNSVLFLCLHHLVNPWILEVWFLATLCIWNIPLTAPTYQFSWPWSSPTSLQPFILTFTIVLISINLHYLCYYCSFSVYSSVQGSLSSPLLFHILLTLPGWPHSLSESILTPKSNTPLVTITSEAWSYIFNFPLNTSAWICH